MLMDLCQTRQRKCFYFGRLNEVDELKKIKHVKFWEGLVTTRFTFPVPFLLSYSVSAFNCVSSHPSPPSAPCPPVSWPSM